MKNSVQVFDFKDNVVRAIQDDNGNPMLVARDVAIALGYSDPTQAVRQHCKNVVKGGVKTTGGLQDMSLIYEPDLYRLIFSSKLDSARKFQQWVFEEVLPAIRKTGSYSTTKTDQRLDRLEAELASLKSQPKPQVSAKPKLSDGLIRQKIILAIGDEPKSYRDVARKMSRQSPFRGMSQGYKCAVKFISGMVETGLLSEKIENNRVQLFVKK